jgi:hypothetical protein
MMTNPLTISRLCAARRKGRLAPCLALCMLGLGVSATAQTITSFNASGAGTGVNQGTFSGSINPAGVIAGY